MASYIRKLVFWGAAFCSVGAAHAASMEAKEAPSLEGKLMISLHPNEVVSYQDVVYRCEDESKKPNDDAQELLKSLPNEGRLKATYIHADMTALVALPIDGNVLTFSNVIAGSGAKYVADRYSWWTKGDEATFARVDKENVMLTCHAVFDKKTPTQSKSIKNPEKYQQKK